MRISGQQYIAKMPVYVNTSIIKTGEELLWYVPTVEKKPTEAKPTKSLEVKLSGNKRQKTSGR